MKTVQLPEIATIIMGQSPPSTSYNTLGQGLPFFQGKTDFGDLHPRVRMFCSSPNKIAEKGDILLSVRAPVGPTNVSTERACIGRGLAAIRASNKVDQWYLLYFFRFYEPQFAAASKGSTFDAITRQDVDRIQIPLPPLPEQQRIAGILSRADRLRRLRRYALEMSEGYLQSVFLEMFGDPATNPMGWEVKSLARIKAKFTYGTSAKCGAEPVGLPVLRIPNVLNREFDLDDLKYAVLDERETKSLTLLQGDVLFVRTNGNPDYVGRCAVFDLPGRYLFASYLIRARIDQEIIDPWYLDTLLRTAAGRAAMFPFIRTTAGQSNIGMEGLGQIPVLLPPMKYQQRYREMVAGETRVRIQQREALRQAEHLFQTLLHGAFRGEML